jgi:hypothetical protein
MTQPAQSIGEMPDTLRRPHKQRLRITTAVGVDQPFQILQQRRIDLRDRLAPATTPAHPPRIKPLARGQLTDPFADRRDRDPRRACRRRDTATPRRARLRRRPQPALTFVQLTRNSPELLTDRSLIRHPTMVL